MKYINKLLKHDYWTHFYFNLDDDILNNNTLNQALLKFWNDIIIHEVTTDDQLIYIIFKAKFNDNSYASISYLQSVTRCQRKELLDTFIQYLDSKAENYSDKIYTEIIFTYHILSPEKSNNKIPRLINKNNININNVNLGRFNFPATTDYTYWGDVIKNIDNIITVKKLISKNPYNYEITLMDDKHHVKAYKGNKMLHEFTDIYGDNHTSFTRIIGLHEYIFENGKVILKKIRRRVKFINKINIEKKEINKFITLDIETRTIDNIFIPYCISFFDGIKTFSFYLEDYKDSQDMLTNCIYSLLKRKYNGYKVYVHNLSNFDGIFLMKILSNIDNFTLNPIIRDGKLINLNISHNIKKYRIDFRDSLLMLPLSLNKLSKAFNLDENSKSIFPYLFVNNPDIKLNYEGSVPNIELFNNISNKDYIEYKNKYKLWNLKTETIKYCELDCKALWLIMKLFNNLIYNKYKLNIHKFPTLPSLAFGIYKCHFMKDKLIPKISGDIYNFVKMGYTGGHTDMYIPFGENVNAYDVNSLYPSVMKFNDMPVGTPQYFEFSEFIEINNLKKIFNNPFGFFEVEITTPENMNRPIFQTKVKTNNGIRTVAPLGTWTDIIFSEEMFKYLEYGYKFKVKRGYLFEKDNIFKYYVDELYLIKQSHNKDHPMYLIAKLLMNSLYGRFGMSDNLNNHVIVNNNELNNLFEHLNSKNAHFTEIIDFNNGKTLLTIKFDDINQSTLSNRDISIPIAAAVTSYSRIFMSQYLSNPDLKILYTDTDSIYTQEKLPNSVVNNELGGWKLEQTFKEVVFIAPKVYGGITNDGKEITKVKGFKNKISFNELKPLLIREEKIKLKQDKWFKSVSEGNIKIKQNIYTLAPTENKRKLIIEKDIIIGTEPFKIDKNKILNLYN